MSMNDSEILFGPAEEIKSFFAQSEDPSFAIEEIQRIYGLHVQGLDAIYPLLDLTGYSRAEIHKTVLDALNKAVIDRIESPEFGVDEFFDMFNRTYRYIHVPMMQPVIMALLKKFEEHVDSSVLDELKANPEIFNNCPKNIKQSIWKQDEEFFQSYLLGYLNDYHYDEQLQVLAMNLRPDSYQEVLEKRRRHPIVKKILDIVDNDPVIYRMFVNTLRLVFSSSPFTSLCSLRVDILMIYHSKNAQQIFRDDPCHNLVWSLDACLRTQKMDDMIVGKIMSCFDDVRNGSQTYREFAMILMDPIISNFLAFYIVKWLRLSVDDGAPDNLNELISYNSRLLNMAEHAPMAMTVEKIPKTDKSLQNHFWGSMCMIIVREHQMNGDIDIENKTVITDLLVRSDIARRVMSHYLLDRLYDGDLSTLNRCLPYILASLPPNKAENDAKAFTYQCFIRTLVDSLIKTRLVSCVTDLGWRRIVVEQFLMKVVSWDPLAHEYVVWFLVSFFKDVKYLRPLRDNIAVLAGWAEQACQNGIQTDKSRRNLFIAYASLLSRSHQIADGQYRISPPAVISFCQLNEQK